MILWDSNCDHPCTRLRDWDDFVRQVARGLRSGKGFRIGYTPEDASPEEFEKFALLAWSMLDGKRPTYAIVEELADVSRHAGTAPGIVKKLMNQGRKYGLRFHGCTQRPEEIYKTFYTQVGITYYGRQKTVAQCQKFSKEIDIPFREIKALPDLCFYIDDGRTVTRKQLKYKKAAKINSR
ncbi:hypothetical protein [Endozoicomonas arenosclerae]|uniref:hypothetical protein n=1 Tax=Endozoicomonas arenosclerae TaxID=1633495 RepID=UPI00155FDE61|nr:hypothetical protein [Endozoicomonas arenosclerae]